MIGWGRNQNGKTVPPAGLTNVVAVSAGRTHSLALTANGAVVGWGGTPLNGAGKPPRMLDNVVSICASDGRSVALRADGAVVSWGPGREAPPMSDVIAIADAYWATIGLKSDGTVTAWPNPGNRRFNTLSNVVAITASENIGYAVRSDGVVFVIDGGQNGRISGATNIVAIAANVFLRSNGTMSAVPGVTNVIDIGTGGVPFGMMTVAGGSAAPRIQPEVKERYTVVGGSVFFAPRVVGKHPFTYEWLRNGEMLAGETNRFLRLTNVTSSAAGRYQVWVRNVAGETLSEEMRLLVKESQDPNIAIEQQPIGSRVWIRADGPAGSVLSLEISGHVGGFSTQRRLTNVTGTLFVEDVTTPLAKSFYRLKKD